MIIKERSMKHFLLYTLCTVLILSTFSGCRFEKETSSESQKVTICVGDVPNPDTNPEEYKRKMDSIKKFEALYPNIKVEPDTWTFDPRTFMVKAEGNTLPTTYYVPLTEAGLIINLEYSADVTEEFKARGFYDNVNDFILDKISKNGKVYLIPRDCYDVGLAVNLDLYKQVGLVAEDGTPHQPETWDELAQIAVKIKEKTGKAGFVLPTMANAGGWRFTPIAWSFGTVFEEKVNGSWRAAFDTPECIAALQFIKDLKWKYNVLPANILVDLNEANKQMGTGECAMTLGELKQINKYFQYGIDINKIGVVKIPAGPKRRVSLMGGGYQAINRNATQAQIKAAMDWTEFNGYTTRLNDERKESILNKIAEDKASGYIIGFQSLSPWKDNSEVEMFRKQAYTEHANVNLNHIKLYNDKSDVEYQAEEPIDAQALYEVFDACIQYVLTDKDADCAKAIKDTAKKFQENHLQYAE